MESPIDRLEGICEEIARIVKEELGELIKELATEIESLPEELPKYEKYLKKRSREIKVENKKRKAEMARLEKIRSDRIADQIKDKMRPEYVRPVPLFKQNKKRVV